MRKLIITLIAWIAVLPLLSCSPGPKIYSQNNNDLRLNKSIAVLPFANFSGTEDAGRQIYNAFLVELLSRHSYKILEPGEVDRVLREERVRITDRIDFATLDILKNRLKVDYILLGSVNEYDYQKSQNREIPRLGFTVRLLDINNGQIVWAANHNRKGDDTELIFGWGIVSSLSDLTSQSVRQVVKKIKVDRLVPTS